MIPDREELLGAIRAIHAGIREAVVFATERQAMEQLAEAVAEEGGDTIFAIDRVSESVLLERFAALAERWPMVLVAEGLGASGQTVLPEGAPARRKTSSMARAHCGTFEACLRRPVLPAITAGAAKRKTCHRGKFQGMIARTGPSGR